MPNRLLTREFIILELAGLLVIAGALVVAALYVPGGVGPQPSRLQLLVIEVVTAILLLSGYLLVALKTARSVTEDRAELRADHQQIKAELSQVKEIVGGVTDATNGNLQRAVEVAANEVRKSEQAHSDTTREVLKLLGQSHADCGELVRREVEPLREQLSQLDRRVGDIEGHAKP